MEISINDAILDKRIRTTLEAARPTSSTEHAFNTAFATIKSEARCPSPSKPGSKALPFRQNLGLAGIPVWARVAAVACMVCLGVGSTAYAADKLGIISLSWHGNHSAEVILEGSGIVPDAADIPAYRLVVNPPVMFDYNDVDETYFKTSTLGDDENDNRFITVEALYLDQPLNLTEYFALDADIVEMNGREGALVATEPYRGGGERYILYLPFPDEQRVAVIWTCGLSRDEANECAASISFEPTGEMVSSDTLWRWSDFVRQEARVESADASPTILTDEEMGVMHSIGEEFVVDSEQSLSAKVTDVQVLDNLSTLTNDEAIPSSWKKLQGSDGRLGADTISFIKLGDGISTLDEVVDTAQSDVALVHITVQYTNTGQETIGDTLYFASLLSVTHENGTWKTFDRAESREDADVAQNSSWRIGTGEMAYYDTDAEGSSSPDEPNHLVNLAPGQTAKVHLAWLVNRDELDKIMLSLDPAGNSYQLSADSAAIGYVDIRQ